jgi:hypothetical protein
VVRRLSWRERRRATSGATTDAQTDVPTGLIVRIATNGRIGRIVPIDRSAPIGLSALIAQIDPNALHVRLVARRRIGGSR